MKTKIVEIKVKLIKNKSQKNVLNRRKVYVYEELN